MNSKIRQIINIFILYLEKSINYFELMPLQFKDMVFFDKSHCSCRSTTTMIGLYQLSTVAFYFFKDSIQNHLQPFH